MITVGSLFSGVGGIDLGLQQTGGFKTIWFSEIEPYCNAVLEERFPGVPNIGDITKVDWDGIEKPDMLVGGFPCQDISWAGKGKGIAEGLEFMLHDGPQHFKAMRHELAELKHEVDITQEKTAEVAAGIGEVAMLLRTYMQR